MVVIDVRSINQTALLQFPDPVEFPVRRDPLEHGKSRYHGPESRNTLAINSN